MLFTVYSEALFLLFDWVLLLKPGGRVIYFGPLGEDYFAEEAPYEGMEPPVSDSDDEACCMHLIVVGMNGSEFIPETQQDSSTNSAVNFEDLESIMTWNPSQKLRWHAPHERTSFSRPACDQQPSQNLSSQSLSSRSLSEADMQRLGDTCSLRGSSASTCRSRRSSRWLPPK